MWMMKYQGGFLMDEMLNMYPFEFELFYFMMIKTLKEEHTQRQNLINAK